MADYGTSDTSTTSLGANQFPISDVYVPNTGLRATEGGPVSTDAGGKASAPTSMYVKDGGDVAQGLTTDAAVTGDNSGTLSAKLRGLTKIWADVWDSVNHLFHFNVKQVGGTAIDTNSGNKSAGTQRVVLATDQPAVPVSGTFWQATQPVSGTITANAGTGTFTNQQSNVQADYDTGAGTQNVTMQGIALPASGGAVAGGTATNPVRTDPTGATVQPVSGTFWQATQPVSGTFWQTTQPVSLSSLPSLAAGSALIGSVELVDSAGTNKLAIDASGRLTLIPNSSINNAQVAGTAVSVNMGNIDAGTQRVAQGSAGTGTKSNVASSATSVTILASNASRKGAIIYNDSTQILYLDLSGGTASNVSYSVQVPANGYFEVPGPAIYSGAITGIWAAANGNARVTEFS